MKVIEGMEPIAPKEQNEVDEFIADFIGWHNRRIKRIKDKRPDLVKYIPGKTEVIMKNRKSSGAK